MTLAIDTSLGTSFALINDSGTLAAFQSADPRRHVEALGALMDSVDKYRNEITKVVIGMGPGPFTGLRVGIATGEALATGLGVPCIRICSHDAAGRGTNGDVVVTSDVRRGERAWTLYRDGVRIDGPNLAPKDAVPVPEGATRLDIEQIDAAQLATAAQGAEEIDGALYLRPADAAPPGPPKTVSTAVDRQLNVRSEEGVVR